MTPVINMAAIGEIIDRLKDLPGALLPILHEIQHVQGFVPSVSVPAIAEALSLSRAEVHGVISFYHHFHSEPMGQQVVQICRAEACQAVGARELEQHMTNKLGINVGETTSDGAISLEPVYCLGNCACGPSVQIDDQLHARVTPERFDALVSAPEAK
ncbi:MAG: formate dehydrogenase subunit gamma [Gammaproteobacteria bacterium]|nr:formate dehydrogenase subunit gamma [Gammaproteobacteria bacterium]MBQ0838225.1 formate dehydrogenase subunit gamma [Gammaproteobacteria bacterium]